MRNTPRTPKSIPSLLAVAVMAGMASGATVSTSTYAILTDADGSIESSGEVSSGLVSSEQVLEFNANQNGLIRAAAIQMVQGVPDGPGTFSFTAGDITPSSNRPADWPVPTIADGPFGGSDANIAGTVGEVDPKAKVRAGAVTTFEVAFALAAGEVKRANFFLHYTIEIENGNQNTASVEWLLQAPDMSVLGISGMDTRTGDAIEETVNTPKQSVIISQPGTYTWTMHAIVPVQEFANAQKSASATLDAVYFEVVNIPEPGSAALLLLATGALLPMRRR